MSETPERPKWRTGVLWGILGGFVIAGSAGGATCVYGALALAAGDPFGVVFAVGGAVAAVLATLFTLGILYRVDRYRGVPLRTVKLFE